ncbi:MAG: hypothetical protein ABSA45_12975 [Verrucomicrobiota bacterium]|jgi:hypothetical protein
MKQKYSPPPPRRPAKSQPFNEAAWTAEQIARHQREREALREKNQRLADEAEEKPPARNSGVGHGGQKAAPPLIVPGWLDDAGLRPSQFRVLCRVARRGDCFEALPAFAAGCLMKRVTAQKALRELVDIELLTAEPRPGRTTIYRINPDPPQKGRYVSPSPNGALGSQPKRGAGYPSPSGRYEGVKERGQR